MSRRAHRYESLFLLSVVLCLLVGCRLGYEERRLDASVRDADGNEDADSNDPLDADRSLDADTNDDVVVDAESDVAGDVEGDAEGDSDPDEDIDERCLEGEYVCSGLTLMRCVDGRLELVEECSLGCGDSLGRCLNFVPSNVPGEALDAAIEDIVVSGDVTVDTDECDPSSLGTPPPHAEIVTVVGGPELCVMSMITLLVEETGRVTVTGDRGFVLLALEDISVHGAVDASAWGATPGPGGGLGGGPDSSAPGSCGGAPGEHVDGYDSGGGGGGHGSAGGDGGDSSITPAAGGEGGGPAGEAPLIPLSRGCGGGGGASDVAEGGEAGAGGAGGGALQLSAELEIRIESTGSVVASGGGGGGGGLHSGGGGGGAGGGVLVEARVVTVEGVIAVNGGGGGASDRGADGSDGLASDLPAPGGTTTESNGGPGGSGGSAEDPAGDDAPEALNGPGGGGSAGRVRINTQWSVADLPGIVSPSSLSTFSQGRLRTR